MEKRLYKDATLLATIEKIKNILLKNGINVTEKLSEGFDGVFSVHIVIDSVGLGTSGKGLTKEAALASAYGELMERIQNFALYKFTFPINENSKNLSFYYAPDEKEVNCNRYLDFIKVLGHAINIKDDEICILSKLNVSYEQKQNSFFVIPYKCYFKRTVIQLPAKLTEVIYASNGMAAGNTYSEALVQSISEIFERYANKIIGEGNITPPDIPIDKIKFSPEVIGIIELLKKKGNFEIIFKDCSLGLGLPVVGMYFIDKDTGKYFVKFGAHPILTVAVERTITELFQGRKFINSILWLKPFSFLKIEDIGRNFEKIYRDGDGIYPYKIFANQDSYAISDS